MAAYSLVAYMEEEPERPFNPEKFGTVYHDHVTAYQRATEIFGKYAVANPEHSMEDFGGTFEKIEVHRDGVMIFELVNHL